MFANSISLLFLALFLLTESTPSLPPPAMETAHFPTFLPTNFSNNFYWILDIMNVLLLSVRILRLSLTLFWKTLKLLVHQPEAFQACFHGSLE